VFNPALAARAFMIASWPVHMTTGWFNFDKSNVFAQNVDNSMGFAPELFDAITQATPLTALKEGPSIFAEMKVGVDQLYSFVFSADKIKPLFFGSIGGVVGETSAIFLLLGGAFLLWKRIITWHIPVAYIGTVAGLALIYYLVTGAPNVHIAVLFHLLSGGLILGAFFMATDMVTSPVTCKGMLIFGAGCGLITFVIRIWGGYPEGVSYSILLMNAVTPLIDRYIKPRVFGT
jgi:electron transport complex protein RnfD